MASISRFMQQRFVHLVMLLRRFGFVQRLRQLRHISVQTVDSQFRVQEAKAQRRLQRLESSSMEEHCILVPSVILREKGSFLINSGTAMDNMIQELIENVPTILLPVPESEVQLAGYPCQQEIRLSAALLSLLSALLDSGLLRIENTELNTSHLAKMQMLLSRLIRHPEDKLTMEAAAALTNMSYSNFCRSFKSTIGYSYVDFCNVVRIHRAQELLLHSQMSVTEISELLNFGSISYFNRIFKKHTGCTPLTYRSSRR